MPVETPDVIPGATRHPLPRLTGHGCFGCGTENPSGLHMTFFREGDVVASETSLPRICMGWDRIAHGGIVSTLLDEIMAYAAIAFTRRYFVTRAMQVRYRRPVPLETPLRVEGRLLSPGDERGCLTTGRVLDADGQLLADAEGEMRFLSAEQLPMVSDTLRHDMEGLFSALAALDDAT